MAEQQQTNPEAVEVRPCQGQNVNVCVAEGYYGEACVRGER